MFVSRAELPDDRPLTVDDLDQLPDDGNRYELDDGVLVVSPAPALNHQFVLQRLSDLVVVRADSVGFEDKTVSKAPVLAVEIASPSTALYDRNTKKDVYAGFGVASYWLVKPSLDDPRLIAFELRRGSYHQIAEVSGDEASEAARPFAVDVVPAALVAGPWRS